MSGPLSNFLSSSRTPLKILTPSLEKKDQQVISATEFLIGLSDDQIQGHGHQMQRVVN